LGLAAGDPLDARARRPDLVARHDGIRAARESDATWRSHA
jgi:hypothetical protein